ncbi:MAG: hypothetical protein MZV65_44905 [Chromatiales bacterium]|nr:hypothetical protein [Chromatiales bacterium]
MWLSLSLCPLAAVAADEPAPAETIPQHRLFQDSFRFAVGGYYASTSTNVRLDGGGGAGVDINFEDALGLDDRKLVAEGYMQWRFAQRWRLDVDYFAITRRASRTLSRDIQWGDQDFTIGAEVESKFRISDLRASVGYTFYKRSDKELGLGLGLHSTALRASIDASGIGADAAEVLAPLPVVSFYGSFALTDTWAMTTRLDWLSLTYSDYDGEIRSFAIDFLYQPFRHVGFGFGWHGLFVDLGVDNTDWRGQVSLAYQGPAAYVSFSF